MKRRVLLALSLTLLTACGTSEQDATQTPAAADTTSAAPIEIARRHFEQVPDSVLLREGACPFECCVYREWRAEAPIPVSREPAATSPPAFTIEGNTAFEADTGFVRITGPAIVIVYDTVFDRETRRVKFAPGDTLVVLDYLGEGFWNLWHRGRVVEDGSAFWGAEVDSPRGAYYGDYRKEWWVRVRLPDGRTGWFRADFAYQYTGADACG